MFGIGEPNEGDGGQFAGMGGVGIALRANNFLNNTNPAAITELVPNYFFIDLGLTGAYQRYAQSGDNQNSTIGNLNNLSIGFKIAKNMYAAAFVAPLSSVGYAATKIQDIEGTTNSTTSSLFEGNGGISKKGVRLAYLLGKHLSLGTNLSYVSGTITETETQGTGTSKVTSFKDALYADFGMQYDWKLAKDKMAVIGAVYGHFNDLRQDNTLYVSSTSNTSSTISEDLYRYRQCLPDFYGIGFSYNTMRMTLTADYKYYDWSRMQASKSYVKFRNQQMLKLGGSYLLGNIYRHPVRVMGGAGLSNSYVVVEGEKATNYYLSAGANFMFRNNNTLSFGFKYSGQMNATNGMAQEYKIGVFFNLTFAEGVYRAKLK